MPASPAAAACNRQALRLRALFAQQDGPPDLDELVARLQTQAWGNLMPGGSAGRCPGIGPDGTGSLMVASRQALAWA